MLYSYRKNKLKNVRLKNVFRLLLDSVDQNHSYIKKLFLFKTTFLCFDKFFSMHLNNCLKVLSLIIFSFLRKNECLKLLSMVNLSDEQ